MIKKILLGALCVVSVSSLSSVMAEETKPLSNSDFLNAISAVVDDHMAAENGTAKSSKQADNTKPATDEPAKPAKSAPNADEVMLASCDQEAGVYGFSEEKHKMYIDLCIQEKKAQEVMQAASDDSETVLTKK